MRNALNDELPVVASCWAPTAHSADGPATATAPRVTVPAPLTGTGVTDQAVPFQFASAGAPAASEPATQTSLPDRAATLVSDASGGAATLFQADPFQRRTKAPPFEAKPTAQASVAETAATSYR